MPLTTPPNPQGSSDTQEESVVVGRIRGTRGLRGDLRVEVLTDSDARFAAGSVIYVDGRRARVERSQAAKAGLLVKLDIVNNRTEARSLTGLSLTVPRSEVKPLPEGTYYHFQIIGITVSTEEDEYLGEVKEILNTGTNDVYVVRDAAGKELLIPALADVVLRVDAAENKMTVQLPEGLG